MKEVIVPKISKPCWENGAFTIAFVYSNQGNFVLKGYNGDIHEYLKNIPNIKYFARFNFYPNLSGSRGYWETNIDKVYISSPNLNPKKKSFISYPYHFRIRNVHTGKEFKLKRMPNRYIPEIFE